MDGKHDRTTSDVTCHHRLWKAHKVQRCRVWLDITLLGLHARLDDVGRDMTSMPLDNTHDRPMLGVACHHHLKAAHTIERRRAWHDIIALGQQTPLNDVKHGMPSSPLGSTNGQTMFGVACHHSP